MEKSVLESALRLDGYRMSFSSTSTWLNAAILMTSHTHHTHTHTHTHTHRHTPVLPAAATGILHGCDRGGGAHLPEAALPEQGGPLLLLTEGGSSLVEEEVGLLAGQLVHRHCKYPQQESLQYTHTPTRSMLVNQPLTLTYLR